MSVSRWLFSDDHPFGLRLGILVALMSVAALVDHLRSGSEATRWREYPFLLMLGVAGAAFGMAVDLVTSSISPEYFVYGKGLDRDSSLARNAVLLGGRAGFCMGCVASGVLCVADTWGLEKSAPRFLRVARSCGDVAAWAVAVGLCTGIAAGLLSMRAPLVPAIVAASPRLLARYEIVWWVHLGIYAGTLLGVTWQARTLRHERDPVVRHAP